MSVTEIRSSPTSGSLSTFSENHSTQKSEEKQIVFRGRKFSLASINELYGHEKDQNKALSGRNNDIMMAVAVAALGVFVGCLTAISVIAFPVGTLFVAILVSSAIAMSFSAYDFQQRANEAARAMNHMLKKAPLAGVTI